MSEFLSLKEAAKYLGITDKTLRNIKYTKGSEYLPYAKVLGRISYSKEDLDRFKEIQGMRDYEKENNRISTADRLKIIDAKLNEVADKQLLLARHFGIQNELIEEEKKELRKKRMLKAYGGNGY